METGVMYVAFGAKARAEARKSIASLRQHHDWPVLVVGETPLPEADFHRTWLNRGTPGRWAKVCLDQLTPWDRTLFLDADTRIHGDLSAGFRLLDAGYDLVMVASAPQHNDALRHLTPEERAVTLDEIPLDALQLNTGVMWFDDGASDLFELWREEWERWQDKDQGALLRALYRRPSAVALLGWPYNDAAGEIVEHRFGACA